MVVSGFVVAISLGAAVLLALRDVFGRMAVRGIDSVVGTGATAIFGMMVLVAVSLIQGDFAEAPFIWGWPLVIIGLAGIFRIVLARTFLFAGMKRIGAARVSSLATTNTFFAILLGIIFLGERITVVSGGGAALVILGCVLLTQSRSGETEGGAAKNFVIGVGLALLSGFCFGAATAMAKAVLADFPSPNFANVYANAIAIVAYLPLMGGRNPASQVRDWTLKTWGLLALTGSCASLGVSLMYVALAHAPLTLVSPLTQSRPLFVVAISVLFLQAHEVVNFRVAAGAITVVMGTVLLVIG